MIRTRLGLTSCLAILTIASFAASGAMASPQSVDSNAAANKAAMMKIYGVFNSGDLSELDQCVSTGVIEHQGMPGVEGGIAGIKKMVTMMRTAFPDLQMKVEDMIASGDKVVSRCSISGTQKGEWMGMPPSGKSFSIECIDIVRFENGKAAEHWGEEDDVGMMQQLGMMPSGSMTMSPDK